jgi:hypothetical protein
MDDNIPVSYGKDELTFSINLQENKAEDWMADWSGRVVVEGKTYFLNGYIKKNGWIAGRLKPEKSINNNTVTKTPSEEPPIYDDDGDVIPF